MALAANQAQEQGVAGAATHRQDRDEWAGREIDMLVQGKRKRKSLSWGYREKCD